MSDLDDRKATAEQTNKAQGALVSRHVSSRVDATG